MGKMPEILPPEIPSGYRKWYPSAISYDVSSPNSHGLVYAATSRTHASNRSNAPPADDTLPPFAYLTSDEERERKAEAYTPGTYHVVVNPDSFSGLPEYAEASAESTSAGDPDIRRGSVASSKVDSARGDDQENTIETDDPNVVILSKFEDTPRRPSSAWRTSRLSLTPDAAGPSPSTLFPQLSLQDPSLEELLGPLEDVVQQGSDDERLLAHFRDVVWKQLVQTQSFQVGSPVSHFHTPGAEIFEREAATFRPVSPPSLMLRKGGKEEKRTVRELSVVLTSIRLAFPCDDGCLSS
jgi:hypothetical protein